MMMKRTYRLIAGALTAAILSMALTACSSGGSTSGSGDSSGDTGGAAPKKQLLTITTATTGGTFYPIGMGMASLWSQKLGDQGISMSGQSSAGSGENIELLRNNEADLAILQGIFGAMAYPGKGVYQDKAYGDLRTMTMLWPNVEHFVLRENKAETGNVMDLKGQRISIGASGSGTEQSTLTIFEGLGLNKGDYSPDYLGYNESASAMKDGKLDGAALPGGPPVSAVADLMASPIKIKVLEFTENDVKKISAVLDSWYLYTIPAKTYPNQDQPITTIAQPNFLAAHKDLSEETVYLLTKTLFENMEFMYSVHKAAEQIIPEDALNGLPAPLHIGAYKYYKEKGFTIPEKLIPPEATK
jgi:TRAP transporter TAXI family solute receptor